MRKNVILLKSHNLNIGHCHVLGITHSTMGLEDYTIFALMNPFWMNSEVCSDEGLNKPLLS